jgi:hypothetical protein
MVKLAQLTVNEVSAICQADTHVESLSLAASVPENITVPTDSATGKKANFAIFGASVYSDYYARVFDTRTDRVTNGTFAEYVTNGGLLRTLAGQKELAGQSRRACDCYRRFNRLKPDTSYNFN